MGSHRSVVPSIYTCLYTESTINRYKSRETRALTRALGCTFEPVFYFMKLSVNLKSETKWIGVFPGRRQKSIF